LRTCVSWSEVARAIVTALSDIPLRIATAAMMAAFCACVGVIEN
jgi:hypothetical protein